MYRPEIAHPAARAGRHFASGCNHPGEVRGLFLSGRWVGITAGKVSAALVDELAMFSGGSSGLFVDSGAFSEVEFGADGLKVVRPITEADWALRFELYERCAALFSTRCFVVAPDRIGDQQHTLALLTKYAPQVSAIAAARAQVIVPVQKGAIPMGEFFRQQCAALGLRRMPIAGIPMKKDATSLEELASFVESLPFTGGRIHLLGLGPAGGKRFFAAVEIILSRRPDCSITSDSVTVRRLAGRTNGKGGGPRILTREQDRARSIGLTDSTAVKAFALAAQGEEERDEEIDAAHAAGWFDVELFDTLDESLAFHERARSERWAPHPEAPPPSTLQRT